MKIAMIKMKMISVSLLFKYLLNINHQTFLWKFKLKHISKLFNFCNLMLEQRFGRSLLQVDKQSFELHNWLNVNKTARGETSTQSPCSIKLQNLYCAFPLEFYGLDIKLFNVITAWLYLGYFFWRYALLSVSCKAKLPCPSRKLALSRTPF